MLSKSEIKELRDRWDGLPDFSFRQAIAAPDPQSPFGLTHDGHLDFRGCIVNESLHKLDVAQLDCSYCVLGPRGQFVSTVRECLFVGAVLDGNLGTDFENCDFTGASLKESWLRGSFSRCTFKRVNLSNSRANQASFTECDFSGANLRRSSFYGCRFAECDFVGTKFGSGSLADSAFIDCAFDNPDLSKVVLDGAKGILK